MTRTPAPWRVVLLSQHDCVIGADGQMVVHELNANEADGTLIAAAPELLEAGKAVLAHLEPKGYYGPQHDLLVAAIAKAEGKS